MYFPLVRLAALAVAATALVSADAALAQSTKAPAAAAPAQAAPVKLDLIGLDANWIKVCNKDQGSKEVCATTRAFGQAANQPTLSMAVYQVTGDDKRFARFLLPFGLLLKPGFRLIVDKGEPIEGHYVLCFQNGCVGEAELTNANLSAFKKGIILAIVARNSGNNEVTFNAPIKDFGAAFDGPSMDPKEIEQRNAELQKQLEERARQQREMLEKQQSATPAPAQTPAK